MIIDAVAEIAELFGAEGARDYLGEPVTVAAHLLQAGALAEAVAATISVLRPHHVILAGPGLQAFEMMRHAYEERLEQAVLPWLLKSTVIYMRPSESAAIVDGMMRRTLRVVDQSHMETTE